MIDSEKCCCSIHINKFRIAFEDYFPIRKNLQIRNKCIGRYFKKNVTNDAVPVGLGIL